LAYFYAMQSSYQGQLDGIRAGAIAQYKALPEEERTTANKIAIARSAYSTAVSLESGCDAQIAELSDRLRGALKREGMSPAIADQIVSYYVSAKNAQKAAYLSQYKKYLS
ncbi:MAG: hypothetical protein IJT18_02895, partial [Oscillospiraceae bacterium]|nr:hypothetical protein [Oscillospiraceae bacterium]